MMKPTPALYLPIAKRPVRRIFVHSSATKPSMNIGRKEIDRWHRDRGFNQIGYHLVIRRDGTTERGRNVNSVGAHARGNNTGSIGVVMVGGLGNDLRPSANFTRAQFRTLRKVIGQLGTQYPGVEVLGHRDVAPTACPSFDVKAWLDTGEVVA